MKRFKAKEASLMSGFNKASPKMARLCLCRITNESTETESCHQSLHRDSLAVELSIHAAAHSVVCNFSSCFGF